MKYYTEINHIDDFDAWGGGRDTLNVVRYCGMEKLNKLNEIFLEQFKDKIPSCVDINNWLWYNEDAIYKKLGINEEAVNRFINSRPTYRYIGKVYP